MKIAYFCTVLKVNSDDVRTTCHEAQTLAEKQSSFFFITQIGHTPGFSNSKQGPSEDLQKIGPLFSCQWYRELQGIYLYPSLRSFNV